MTHEDALALMRVMAFINMNLSFIVSILVIIACIIWFRGRK